LALQAKNLEYFPLFAETKKEFIVDVIMPLLRTNEEDLEAFHERPDDFVSLALDVVDQQTSGVPKTAAARLLEYLCDHIDGALTYTVVIALNLVDFTLKQGTPDQISDDNWAPLKEILNSGTMLYTEPFLRLDLALLILAKLEYCIPRRPDLM
jgi:hypothetical protein